MSDGQLDAEAQAEIDELVSSVNGRALPASPTATPTAPSPGASPAAQRPREPQASSSSLRAKASAQLQANPTSSSSPVSSVSEEDRLLISKLEREATRLEQEEDDGDAAVEVLRTARQHTVSAFGLHSLETEAITRRLVLLMNSVAMSELYADNHERALEMLHGAEALCGPGDVHAKVQTLNNLACCYRKTNRPRTAHRLLSRSLHICSTASKQDLRAAESTAVCHLNLCAVLSEMSDHEQAWEHAQAAVLHCQEDLLADSIREQLNEKNAASAVDLLTEKILVLGIAYHNLGVEEEHMGRLEGALEWYGKALDLATEHVGPDEPVVGTFEQSYDAVLEMLEKRDKEAESRGSPAKTRKHRKGMGARVPVSARNRNDAGALVSRERGRSRQQNRGDGRPPWKPAAIAAGSLLTASIGGPSPMHSSSRRCRRRRQGTATKTRRG